MYFINLVVLATARLLPLWLFVPQEATTRALPLSDAGEIRTMTAICGGKKAAYYDEKFNVLCIDGQFDVEGRLERMITSRSYRDDLVVVAKSPGGGLQTALDVTRYLERYHYTIIVDGLCASACAQFLFMGGTYKIVTGKGIVAMHGGPMSAASIDKMSITPEGKANLLRENEEFRAFYRAHGIDLAITTNAPQSVLDAMQKGETLFWAPPRAEFERSGVKNVRFVDADIMRQ